LEGARLTGAKGGGANLRRADLGGADLHDSRISGADLRGANLESVRLDDADLSNRNGAAPIYVAPASVPTMNSTPSTCPAPICEERTWSRRT
jgi:hypothetical protein